jgi:hypothetical protein
MPQISPKEWRLIGLIIIFFIGLSLFFWFWQNAHRPAQSIYLGTQYINWQDTPVYYSWINQAKHGAWTFYDLFTSEMHPPFFFDIFWLTLGKLAAIFSLSEIVIYQLAKIVLIPLLIITLYYLVAYFFSNAKTRMLAIIFVVFASGLGGLLLVTHSVFSPALTGLTSTMDLWAVDGLIFFTLFHSPHFMLALSLMILIFLWTLLAIEKKQWRYSAYSGLAALILFQFHPYDAPTTILVMFAFVVMLIIKNKKVDWFNLKHCLLVLMISSPSLIYHWWTYRAFWLKQVVAAQNNCFTPTLDKVVLSYGLPLVLGLLGLIYVLRSKAPKDRNIFLISWLIVQAALIYFPINMQRRFVLGLQVVINILAIFGFIYLKDILKIKKTLSANQTLILIIGFLVIFSCSNYFILGMSFFPTDFPSNPKSVYYLSTDKLEAMKWLQKNTEPDTIVLASYPDSNLIPALALRRVYLGHWDFTADAQNKFYLLNYFFKKDRASDGRQNFLSKNHINYIFYSLEDRNLGLFNPKDKSYLKDIYHNSKTTIYRVINK